MGCSDSCMKYLLFFFNLVFSIVGLIFVIIGGIGISKTSESSEILSDITNGGLNSHMYILVLGIVIFFIASLGCCGAIRENRCMLITFAILLLTIFIVQVGLGIYILTHKSDVKSHIEDGMSKKFSEIRSDQNTRKLFENLERNFECCGVRGFADYLGQLIPVPGSCCEDKSDCRIKPLTYWKNGCATVVTNFTGKAGEVMGGLTIGLSIIEVLGAIFALRLASKYR